MSGSPQPSRAVPGGDGGARGTFVSSSMTQLDARDDASRNEMPPPPPARSTFDASDALRRAEETNRQQRPDLYRPIPKAGGGGAGNTSGKQRAHNSHRKRPWESSPWRSQYLACRNGQKNQQRRQSEANNPLFLIDREGESSAASNPARVKEEAKLMPPPPPKRLKSCLKNGNGPSQQQPTVTTIVAATSGGTAASHAAAGIIKQEARKQPPVPAPEGSGGDARPSRWGPKLNSSNAGQRTSSDAVSVAAGGTGQEARKQPPAAKEPATKEPENDAIDVDTTTSEEMASENSVVDLTADPDRTHAIFAIDFSSSMCKRDVKAAKGKKMSRWQAVFACIDSFLAQQLQEQAQSATLSLCFVSVLIFNDESQVILKRMPLTGDGSKIRQILRNAEKKYKPRGGTGFAAGFKLASQLAQPIADDKVITVFLSDGRPGDLNRPPPKLPSMPMQTTFKRNKQTFPAAGQYIEKMQKRHSDFSLQVICLYNEGKPWLRYLADRYNGTFHHPDLALDDASGGSKPRSSKVSAGSKQRPSKQRQKHATKGTDSESGEDEEVELMHVKSQATLIRERNQRAKAAGDVLSLTQSTNSSSIRSTFSSISATVTAMRSGPKLRERSVVIQSVSAMITYQATRMLLSNGGDKFVVAPGETANGRKIAVSMHPFAQGGLRNVYSMTEKSLSRSRRKVAKESRHEVSYSERLRFHLETVKCQARASVYADSFNKQVEHAMKRKESFKNALADFPGINVLTAEVYRLQAPSCPGGYRYLAVEMNLAGSYEKFNNNDGFVMKSNGPKCQVAQAFSHFTYEKSHGQEMVVDVQGSGYTYTDPQLHSVDRAFGRADRGTVGFDKFFATHKCNHICRELGLAARKGT